MSAAKLFAAEIFDALVEIAETDPARVRKLVALVAASNKPSEPVAPQLLTKHQLKTALNISTTSVDRAVRRGCPYQLVGTRRRFELAAVRAWFTSHKQLARAVAIKSEALADPVDVNGAIVAAGFVYTEGQGAQ